MNCLGVQAESKPAVSGPVVDESAETLAEFRADPELVGPTSACRRATPARGSPAYRGQAIHWGRHIVIEFVDRPDSNTAVVDLGVTDCYLLSQISCEGQGHRVHLTREGGEWIVVSTQPTWIT